MRIDVFSIFPDLVHTYASQSLIGRARERGLVDLRTHDLRSEATDAHRTVDDAPFGGGAGMVLAPEPVVACLEAVAAPGPLYYLGPAGEPFDQSVARRLAAAPSFALLCGRYEGMDQRVIDHWCAGELSVGDYVLAGGEAAAIVVIEAVTRLVPGVMGNAASADSESFGAGRGLLEYPQYTRPAEFRGHVVPEVVRSGDHGRVERWRHAQALLRTAERRPDLLAERGEGGLLAGEDHLLAEFGLLEAFAGATGWYPPGAGR